MLGCYPGDERNGQDQNRSVWTCMSHVHMGVSQGKTRNSEGWLRVLVHVASSMKNNTFAGRWQDKRSLATDSPHPPVRQGLQLPQGINLCLVGEGEHLCKHMSCFGANRHG